MTNRTIIGIGSIPGLLRTATLAGIAGIVCFAPGSGVTGQVLAAEGVITKNELIAEIQRRRAAIESLDVEFAFYAVGEVPTHALQLDMRSVVLEGDKVRIDRTYRIGGVDGGETYSTSASFDGARGWGYQAVNQIAYTRQDGQIPLIELEGSGFFDLILWYPDSVTRGEGLHVNDLLSMLDSPHSVVSEEFDVIDGFLVYVVELRPADQLIGRIWIDPNRGYLPVRQVYYSGPFPTVELRILETVQFANDVWLPVLGERVTEPNPDREELFRGLWFEMKVKEDARGPLLKVNEGVDNGIFDLSRTFPPRTTAIDLDRNRLWKVSAHDYSASADAALASFSTTTRQFGGESSDLGDEALWGDPLWLALMSAAGLVGAGLLLVHHRRAS